MASNLLLLLGMVLGIYFSKRKIVVPKPTYTTVICGFAVSVLLRFNVMDLNHNFGEPKYKYITSLFLLLILAKNGSDKWDCYTAFCAILISCLSGVNSLEIYEAYRGIVLSLICLAFSYAVSKCFEKASYQEDESNRWKMLEPLTQVLYFVVATDVLFMIFKPGLSEYSDFGITGVVLLTGSYAGKLLLLTFDMKSTAWCLMLEWVVKTIMFSLTYTLNFKFDLTIANFLCVLFWFFYALGKFVYVRFQVEVPRPDNHVKPLFD